MGNPITTRINTGTLGELLVQMRLLDFGVQAAAPIKDSGNDLIAIKGEIVKFIQVKTATNRMPQRGRLPKIYHLVALVKLIRNNGSLALDKSEVWILERNEVKTKLELCLVNRIWS